MPHADSARGKKAKAGDGGSRRRLAATAILSAAALAVILISLSVDSLTLPRAAQVDDGSNNDGYDAAIAASLLLREEPRGGQESDGKSLRLAAVPDTALFASTRDAGITLPVSSDSSREFQSGDQGSCDLYHGKWVFDSTGPLYNNASCPVITKTQNCRGNGRPDKDYEYWRWKPEQCILPRFDARKFLELMRSKTLAFVGDSVARNQMESLLCILWQVEIPINRSNRRRSKWVFKSTSTTIIRIWSSWLVHRSTKAVGFAHEGLDKVFLDVPDESFMEFLPSFDVLVLSSGHWFVKKSAYILNGSVVGGQLWWPEKAGEMQMNNIDAFGISVETCLTAVATNPNFTGIAIVRSFSPDHYEGGAWNTGGSCTGMVKPLDEVVRNNFTDTMYGKQATAFRKVVKNFGKPGSRLKLMDITETFALRADGHPGPYRDTNPNKKTERGPDGKPPSQDCLHWCMPGPVDTWNEMLLETITREFEGERN